MKGRRFHKEDYFLLFSIVCFIEIIYFRNVLFTDALIGDAGDTRLNNLILEHWYHVLLGKESFADLIIFFPKKNTITYTDMLCGYAIPYIFLRMIGIGIYNANKIVIILIHSVGTFSVIILLKRILNFNWISTFIGGILFSLSNAIFVQAGHSQLYTACITPIFISFLIVFIKNIENNQIVKKRYGFGLILTYVFMMYTSFYIAFFTALLVFIYGAVVFFMTDKRTIIFNISHFLKINLKMIAAYLLCTIVLVIPFFCLYLPTLKEFGVRDWGNIFLPDLADFVNVSSDSYLYRTFRSVLKLNENIELSTGIPLLTMILFMICYLWLRHNYYIKRKLEFFYMRALSLTVIWTWVLLLKSGDFSLWWGIYKFVPGGGAIRAPFRINLIIGLFIAMVVAYVINFHKVDRKIIYVPVYLLCSAVILLDNLTVTGVSSFWNVKDMSTQLNNVPKPPVDCETMLLINSGDELSFHDSNLLAWEIANKFDLKTVNGYSGQFPKGWPVNNFSYNRNSVFDLCNWIEQYDLKGVYAYDVWTKSWVKDFSCSYLFDEKNSNMFIQNGKIEEERVVLFPEGVIWGPYIALRPGEYSVYIKSEYIDQIDFQCTSDSGLKELTVIRMEKTSKGRYYKLVIDKEESQVEFKVLNISSDNIDFDFIDISKNRERDM